MTSKNGVAGKDWAELRARLESARGPRYWRSLEEVAQTDAFQKLIEDEFPSQASEWNDPLGRRRFLKLMGASLALAGVSSCTRQPAETIVPFARTVEATVPGRPLYFATAASLGGFATGVLVESHMGRPTKIEGNPRHPASLGASDAITQASILGLYDPDRSQVTTRAGQISSCPALGDDPVLFQHLFWFYSHPAVYIMILPSMGVISELVTCFSRKRIFGYNLIAFSSLAIAVLGFLVWGHHMFVSGQSVYAGIVFSFLSFFVAIPSAIKVFNWMATLYKGSVSYDTPMLYAMGFIGLFTIGGLTGLFLSTLAIDVHVHDTYFVVAHFHYIMVGGAIMGYLGGIHFWWPKISGRLYPEGWGRFSALVIFVGFNLTFFPQFILGYLGMPRRYHVYPDEFQVLNVMSSAGASILAVGYLIPLNWVFTSLR